MNFKWKDRDGALIFFAKDLFKTKDISNSLINTFKDDTYSENFEKSTFNQIEKFKKEGLKLYEVMKRE